MLAMTEVVLRADQMTGEHLSLVAEAECGGPPSHSRLGDFAEQPVWGPTLET